MKLSPTIALILMGDANRRLSFMSDASTESGTTHLPLEKTFGAMASLSTNSVSLGDQLRTVLVEALC
jgi:hypothetical protein